MEILGKILGSESKVRIMRLFLFNPEKVFETKEVARRAQCLEKTARREIRSFISGELIRRKMVVHRSKLDTVTRERKLVLGFILNQRFPYLGALQNLVINTVLIKDNDILNRFSGVGHIKLLITSGIFIQDFDSRVDLLIVGDRLRKTLIESRIKKMESEIGKELRYSIFETADFQYRVSIYDKLVRDILEFSHRKVVDKLGIRAPFLPFLSIPAKVEAV